MTKNILATAATLSDDALLARVQVLAGCERQATVELIAHLAELDTRKILVAEGYSLFTYCTRRLGFSEDAACTRIEVARTARRFPLILEGLAEGSWTLTAIRMVAPHLTADNHKEVLQAVSRRSKREIEVLVARLAPRPDLPSSIRKLPARPPAHQPVTGGSTKEQAGATELPALARPADMGEPMPASFTPAAASRTPNRRPVVTPVSPERYQVQFTVGKETHDKLRRLQDLLRREIPSGDPAAIVDRALTLLLQDVEKRKLRTLSTPERARTIRSGTDAPRERSAPGSRDVPASLWRAVWKRDSSQCAFVSKSGHRCTERALLEVHHIHPYALGGPPTLSNLCLLCKRHNHYEAELIFGPFDASSVRESTAPYPSLRTVASATDWPIGDLRPSPAGRP